MQMTGNTILITGGGSGIGRALAEAFHKRGNTVVIAARRRAVLDDAVKANPGMYAETLDVNDPAALRTFAATVQQKYPQLNAVILNAGIMRTEEIDAGELDDAEATIATNILGPLRLTSALLPGLKKQPRATIMTVTSGLAFVPLAYNPAYCASKAYIHSWTQSLRYQLRRTEIEVLELVPPYVQTELQGAKQASDPNAMPLEDYIAEVMGLLETDPEAREICVKRVYPQRFAERENRYDEFYRMRNDGWAQANGK